MSKSVRVIGGLCAAAAIGGNIALADDIDLRIVGGKIQTHLVSEIGVPLGPSRVFGGGFAEVSGQWFADDPGFQVAPGQLNSGGNLLVAFTQAMRVWNGSNFATIAANSVTATYGIPSNTITTPFTDMVTANLLLPVQAGGGLHEHPDLELNVAPGNNDPAFYLVTGRLSYAGVQDSDPFFIVFGVNATDDQIGEIQDWVNTNLVPAPAALSLFMGIGVLAARRRR
ncbi:MAG: hypothetical protein ACREJD_14030 [Phycisphaerales bacterium]